MGGVMKFQMLCWGPLVIIISKGFDLKLLL